MRNCRKHYQPSVKLQRKHFTHKSSLSNKRRFASGVSPAALTPEFCAKRPTIFREKRRGFHTLLSLTTDTPQSYNSSWWRRRRLLRKTPFRQKGKRFHHDQQLVGATASCNQHVAEKMKHRFTCAANCLASSSRASDGNWLVKEEPSGRRN